jgi:mono/diheme cytochrome c family protein
MRSALTTMVLLAALTSVQATQAAGPEGDGEPGPGQDCPDPMSAPPALDGAELFGQHCAMCHKPGDVVARKIQGAPDPDAARSATMTFLARHGRCDAAADQAIIDYLARAQTP